MAKRERINTHLLLASGEMIPGPQAKYRIEGVLETDGHATVYAARDTTAPWRRIALKEFIPARPEIFERESRVTRQAAAHPLTPAFYEAFSHDGYFYIARELVQGETLASLIPRHQALPRRTILKWAVCLCHALTFLHARRIVRHDLKPSNISVNPRGYPILLDFGGALSFSDREAGTGGDPPEMATAARADVFSLGCLLYEMIAGLPPEPWNPVGPGPDFTGELASRANADPSLVALLARMLAPQKDDRPVSAADLLQELRTFAPPVLLADTHQLNFGPTSEAAPQTVRFRNAGGGQLDARIESHTPWLQFDPPVHQGDIFEAVARVDASRIRDHDQWIHGGLEIISTGADEGDDGPQPDDRWLIDCSVIAPPLDLTRLTAGVRTQERAGAAIVPPTAPRAPEPPPAAPAGRTKGETDIVPKSTVIRLIAAIILLALVIGYVVVHQITGRSEGPAASAPGGNATPPPIAIQPSPPTPLVQTASAGNLLQPTGDAAAWMLEQNSGGVGSLTTEGQTLHVTVSRPGKKYWHVQFYQTPPGLRSGQTYTLTFRAKADSPCDLPVGGSVNYGDFHPIGLTTHFALGRDWKTFSHSFVTQQFTGDNVRLPVFMVGTKPHQYWLTDVVLKKSAR
ncbi:MAG: carbohydrate binding domain-containing protein [Armatimonadetes bacterium]|nr:carbohydrate binding domain-containing protein [Armatimonadota bacterium]